MNKENRKKIMIVLLLLILIGVGYAILTTQLDIKGTTTIKNHNFSIIFSNLVEKEGSVTATTPAKIDEDNGTSIEFDVSFTHPGDYYGFSVDVKNNGQLDAMVDTLEISKLTETQQKYLEFTIVDSDGIQVNSKDLLKRGTTRTINILVKYRDDLLEYPSTSEESVTLTFQINYIEADDTAVEINPISWANRTAVFVGDSITAGSGTTKIYYQYLQESLELASATGKGIAGSAISVNSDYGTSNTPLINRYQSIPDADLITVFMGSNDYGHETPLGTIDDTTDVSFYGALNVIVPGLKEAHPNSRIVFMTPTHRYGFGTSKILGTAFTYDHIANGAGATLEDYANAIKEVCAKYDIPVIDLHTLFTLDVTDADVRTEYIPDGLHPNAKGHAILADLIETELNKIEPPDTTTDTDPEEVSTNPNLITGNKFLNTYENATNRATARNNIYLEAGVTIILKDPSTYNYGIAAQSSSELAYSNGYVSGTGWQTASYTTTTAGWYGFTFKRVDDADFAFGTTDPSVLLDYITIE